MSPRRVTLTLVAHDPADTQAVERTIASLTAQTVAEWELLVPAAVPLAPGVSDDRIRAVADGVGLDDARGVWWGLVDAGDTLEPDALELLLGDLAQHPDAVLGYTDEQRRSVSAGRAAEPIGLGAEDEDAIELLRAEGDTGAVRKPDWSPERQRHGDVVGRLALLRTETARQVGGWDTAAEPAAEYDLVLRVTETGGAVVHVPEVLYHSAAARVADDGAAARAAAQRHVERVGLPATVVAGPAPGTHRLVRTLDPRVRVSVVIPTRWQVAEIRGRSVCLPVEAVRAMVARTDHEAVEFVVVFDEPVPDGVLDELHELTGGRLVAVPYRKPFNFSEKCNIGFLHATGEVVVLANDDLEPVSEHWLESLVAPALEPDVGLVGCKMLYEDGTVQNGGHVHVRDLTRTRPSLAYRAVPADTLGEQNCLVVNREITGVSGACMALRRDVYEQVGGLCEELPLSFNDVDLSLKIDAAGYRILWLAEPVLYHYESKSRDPAVRASEMEFMFTRWGGFEGDRYMPWLSPRAPRRRAVAPAAG